MTDAPVPVDLLVCGSVVTMDGARSVHADGAVAVSGTDIVDVGPRDRLERRYAPRRRIDPADAFVLPGLIDGHTHTTQALVRGLIAGELPMIFRLYVPAMAALTPDEAALAATLCAAQLLRSGVTTVCEGAVGYAPEVEAAVLDALTACGIRVNIVRGSGDQGFHHAALYSQVEDRSWFARRAGEAEADLARTEALLARHDPRGSGLVSAGVCASSLPDFSTEYFVEADRLAQRYGAKLHVHLARDREEVEFCLAAFGRRPIEQLDSLGLISDRLVAAHCMLATEREIEMLRRGGAAVAHSPIECLNILNAVPGVQRMRASGIRLALGCDNAVNDIWENMRAVWLMQGTARGLPAYDAAHADEVEILAMASSEAASVLGLDGRIGSIEPGKAADLVVVDGSGAHFFPRQNPLAELLRYGTRNEVSTVIVNGRVVVDGGRHATVDLAGLRAAAEPVARRLAAIIEPRRYVPVTLPLRAGPGA